MTPRVGLPLAAIAFAIVATANAGGYRFGVSDQAYYEPAIARVANPALFPRDSGLLEVQSRFLGSVHLLGDVAGLTGAGLPAIFLVTYALTMAGLFAASVLIARRLGLSWWAAAAFLVLLTLRHRIARTGANSIEGYMHPRMLAFVFGLAASAALLRGRAVAAVAWTLVSGVMHPTTGLWFSVVVAVALASARPAWRKGVALAAAVAVVGACVLALAGPLAGRLTVMDADWLSVLADKDYVFPSEWPAYAWLLNLAYPIVIALVYRARRRVGVARPAEGAVVTGLLALVLLFLLSVPFSAARVAIAVQLQVNRVFWVTDYFAMAYLAWWLVDRRAAGRARGVAVAVLATLAIVRGAYVLRVEADRSLFQASLPTSTWTDALTWLRSQPADWFVLADPGHAWKYGVSVRVGAHRDTLLESGKDSSMAMYDRSVALRVKDRTAALADFETLDTAGVRALASRYHLDVLVDHKTRRLDLPVLYENAEFAVYDLR